MNDVATQNMFLLTDNILPHRTCLKLKGKILNKCLLSPLNEFLGVFGYLVENQYRLEHLKSLNI